MSTLTLSLLVLFSVIAIIYLTSKLKLNAFISLFVVSLFLALTALPEADIVNILTSGFGKAMKSTGLVIIFGSIIAIVLDKSGGALSIANYMLSKTGVKKAPAALGLTGFVAGLPIFCDSGYIILSGLAKSFSAKSKINMPFIAAVLACSLYSVHCLVPMHPGALAASVNMKVNIGYFILAGTLFAIPATLAAYFWIKKRTQNKGYEPAHFSEGEMEILEKLPSVGLSLFPIITPLLLITISTLAHVFGYEDQNAFVLLIHFIGKPVIALLIGAILSLLLLKRGEGIKKANMIFEEAIEKSGPILIIIAGGGMFGAVIEETGVGHIVGQYLGHMGLGLAVPFLMAFLLKTALGSSTVAIITASSFIPGMLPLLGLDSELGRLFATLAMAAGSMMISHANDPYFWVVTQFSEIKTEISLKVYSTATVVMGVTSFVFIWLVSLFIL